LMGYTIVVAVAIAVFVAWLSLSVSPAGAAKAETILKAQKAMTELDRVSPKRFYNLGGDKGVTYAERIRDNRELEDVFLAFAAGSVENLDSRLVVVVAELGRQQLSENGSERFLVLDKGYRFEGIPGKHDFQITNFQQYGSKLQQVKKVSDDPETDAMATAELWMSSDPELKAALQWRMSTPLMVLIIVLLAVPLSRTNPRQGRYARLLPAILIYFVYLLSLNAVRGSLETGEYSVITSLLPVHLLFLLIGSMLIMSEWLGRSVRIFGRQRGLIK
jgi:lipopolysaccharide export system permease protein